MTTLCIAGNCPHDLTILTGSLAHAGMASPRPLQRDPNVTLSTWLDRVSAAHPQSESESESDDEPTNATPSRLWEQLAVDLMLSNLDAPLWGWADVRNVETLEFWAGLDASICFVLLCQTRTQALEAMTLDGHADPTAAIATWRRRHRAMLRFYLRHPARSILLWADHALSHPRELVAEMQRRWAVAIDATAIPASLATPANPVLRHLCNQCAEAYAEYEELEHEVAGNVEPLAEAPSPLNPPPPNMVALLQGYRVLEERGHKWEQAYQRAVTQIEHDAAQLVQAKEDAHRLAHLVEEKTKQMLAAEVQLSAAIRVRQAAESDRDTLAQEHALLRQKVEEIQRENDLLLEQLHGIQEELERYYARQRNDPPTATRDAFQQLSRALEEKSRHLQALELRMQEESLAHAEAMAHHAALAEKNHRTLEERTRQVQALEKRIEEITHQQHATAKQCDALTQDKKALQAQHANAAQELQKLRADVATATQEKTRLANELEKARNAQTATQAKLAEIQKENDEVIRQLHLVQEELERYYLRHRSTREELDRLTAHWTRVMRPHPDWVYAERSEHASQDTSDSRVDWTFHQASIGERTFDALRLTTVVEHGVAGLVLSREGGPLLHWPLSARDAEQITLLPVRGDHHAAKLRAAHLLHLSASDWDFCLAVPQLLTQVLNAPDQTLPAPRAQALREGLERLTQLLHGMQGLVRFDTLALVGHSSTPQRCVLALRLRPLHFARHRTDSFEFQIQTNLLPTGMLDSAHLIFAQSTLDAPFEGWKSNVPNTAGEPVMALRLAPTGWDTESFGALPKADRHFVVALVAQLTVMFVALQAQKAQASTPWKNWIEWANALRKWAQHQPAPEPIAHPPSPSAPPIAAPVPTTPAVATAAPAATAPAATKVATKATTKSTTPKSTTPATKATTGHVAKSATEDTASPTRNARTASKLDPKAASQPAPTRQATRSKKGN